MNANLLRRVNWLWKHRHNHDGEDFQEQINVIRTTVEEQSDDIAGAGSGAYIHLTASTQTIAVDGEDIEWAGIGSNGRYAFAKPSLPVTEVEIPKAGYYDIWIPVLEWDTWTEGGTVEVWRTRDGVETKIWPPLADTDWTSEGVDVEWKADGATAVWFEPGDLVSVFLDHGDSTTKDLRRAYLSVYLVDRGGVITACPNLGSEVTVSSVEHDAFPAFAVADDGTYIITYRQGDGHQSTDGVVKMRTSTDGGANWSAATTIYSDASFSTAGGSMTKLASGRIVLLLSVVDSGGSKVVDGAFTMYTDDGGDNWSTPARIDSDFTDNCLSFGTLAELDDGTWLLAVFGHDTGDNTDYRDVRLISSDDDGATWSTITTMADGQTDQKDYNETGLVRVGNQIIATIRENTVTAFGGAMYRSVSTDDGATWSNLEEITVSGKTLGGISNLCLRANGDLMVVWRDIIGGGTSYPQSLYRSGDLGQTWEECTLLDGSLGVYGQPAEDLDGKLGVAYADEVANDATSDADVNFRKES